MLIRTQNKRRLVDMAGLTVGISYEGDGCKSDIIAISNQTGNKHWTPLGTYSTEEKALKVLDMIQKEYLSPIVRNTVGENEVEIYQNKVFKMPDDEEV